MGTNYYAHQKQDECPTCGRSDECEPIHIGKSSGGWHFALHVYPENQDLPQSLEHWINFWNRNDIKIKNEYNATIDPDQMLNIILKRSSDYNEDRITTPLYYESWKSFYEKNHAERGLNGLVRYRIDGRFCIKHGLGTYDLCVGEFS